MLEALQRVGVRQLTLAVESGSSRVLRELMRKPLALEITRRVAKDCRELGIYTDCNIIIGMPGETLGDIEESRTFLKTLDASWFRINVATPLVGSEMYEVAQARNYLVGDILSAGYKASVLQTEEFTPAEIEQIAYDLNLELNFVHNSNMRAGRYQEALTGFENVIRARGDHVLAYYFAARCAGELGRGEQRSEYLARARQFAAAPQWQAKLEKLGLVLSDL
jgi:radical SAM superfamily enzyme YgiQ (UPF0313 family)